MVSVKLRSALIAVSLGLLPFAASAYKSTGDFPGASDGPSLATDYGQSLDFGFSSPSDPGAYGLRSASSGQAGMLNETQSQSSSAAPQTAKQLKVQVDQFSRDFYGYR